MKLVRPNYLIIALFTLIGFFVGYFIHPNKSNIFTEIRNKSTYTFINPLLECEYNFSPQSQKNTQKIKNEISNYINQSLEDNNIFAASIYFRDLNNGPSFGINEKELFSPASLLKVPLMIAYFKESEYSPGILQQSILFDHSVNQQEQNIKPEKELISGEEYSIEELIRRMIVYSDNEAYELLINNINITNYEKIFNDLGIDISLAKDNPGGNIINIKSYASFFRVLYNASYLSKEMSETALDLLSQSTYKKGLVKPLPKDLLVAHKFGERNYLTSQDKQLHDCGIIYLLNKPYLLCIMSKGNDFDTLSKFIQNASYIVYKHLI
jgi:beta-lactamase class A